MAGPKAERRKYQDDAFKRLPGLIRKHRKVLLVAPTGSGKTQIGAQFVKSWRGRVLWLAHRRELIGQAHRTLMGLGVDVGVVMDAYTKTNPSSDRPGGRRQQNYASDHAVSSSVGRRSSASTVAPGSQ